MSKSESKAENGIDKRTRRACTGCMVVVPHGHGTGLFDVYSANDGKNTIYTVDLREERCTCPDHMHREVECKHIRRVKLALGISHPPAGIEIDDVLARSRAKYGADVDPNRLIDAEPTRAVATDGGRAYTTHREPPAQGGKEYARCTGCEREIVPVDRFEQLTHANDCPNGVGQ